MAALVSLSTAANVAAMISLADMAFKTGTQVCDLCCRYRDAPRSISQLVDEIKASTSNIAHARIFMQEFGASAFAVDNGHMLPQIEKILCLLDQEFKHLRKLVPDMMSSSSGGLLDPLRRVASRLRWSLDDRAIATSCANLHTLKTDLSIALGITGGMNDIILRNEITATRTEVVKFTNTWKKLEDYINVLSIVPSTTTSGIANNATRLPFRNTRTRLRGSRRASQRQCVLPAISDKKSEIVTMEPLSNDDYQSAKLRKVSLRQHESGTIGTATLTYEDMTLPLIQIRGLLRTVIEDIKLSDCLIVSGSQTEEIAFIIDQLLAHSHIAAAASLSRGSQRFSAARDCLITPRDTKIPGTSAQTTYCQSRTDSLAPRRSVQQGRLASGLWMTQTFSKTTPWGTIKAEIHIIGDRLYSEILCFRLGFSPNRKLSDIGVVIDYASHHIKLLFGLYHLPFHAPHGIEPLPIYQGYLLAESQTVAFLRNSRNGPRSKVSYRPSTLLAAVTSNIWTQQDVCFGFCSCQCSVTEPFGSRETYHVVAFVWYYKPRSLGWISQQIYMEEARALLPKDRHRVCPAPFDLLEPEQHSSLFGGTMCLTYENGSVIVFAEIF